MKLISTLAAIAATAMLMPAAAQTTQKLTATKANEYGLIYSLPVTELDITIETEHSRRTPGEFYNYSRRHLGLGGAITEPSTTVTVKSVTITPRGVADPDNRWLVQFKSGSTPYMLLTPEGLPLAVNTESVADSNRPALPEPVAPQPTILETDAARQAMTQDMIRSSSTSKRAELAAQRIFELRDTRSDLLSGQADNAPADGQAMQLVLDNLSRQEAALTAMFTGTEQKWTSVETISVRPDSLGLADEVIARISPIDGILTPDNLAGAPVTLSIDIIEQGSLPVNDKGEAKRFPKGGLAYTIPGRARVSVNYDGHTIASTEVSLAQIGVTFGLDPSLFTDKKAPSKLQLDPTTGAVVLLGPAD
ncbi:MAG: DUF4831 family protein [Bacteroidales bacterium]|nr:DUF4831 family protein [Bacteroidales bacterium]